MEVDRDIWSLLHLETRLRWSCSKPVCRSLDTIRRLSDYSAIICKELFSHRLRDWLVFAFEVGFIEQVWFFPRLDVITFLGITESQLKRGRQIEQEECRCKHAPLPTLPTTKSQETEPLAATFSCMPACTPLNIWYTSVHSHTHNNECKPPNVWYKSLLL